MKAINFLHTISSYHFELLIGGDFHEIVLTMNEHFKLAIKAASQMEYEPWSKVLVSPFNNPCNNTPLHNTPFKFRLRTAHMLQLERLQFLYGRNWYEVFGWGSGTRGDS